MILTGTTRPPGNDAVWVDMFRRTAGIIGVGSTTVWQASQSYAINSLVRPPIYNGWIYQATAGGVSGATEPSWSIRKDDTFVDGGVTWRAVKLDYYSGAAVVIRANASTLEEVWIDEKNADPYGPVVGSEGTEPLIEIPASIGAPPGTFFDYGPVHLVATGTLARLSDTYPEGRFDARRFRPNVVVEIPENVFTEAEWVGRVLAIGEAHAQGSGPKLPSSTRRFMDGLLPRLSPRATDLVIELWVANGSCGNLMDALIYEKRIETFGVASGLAYFDARGWGILVKDTPIQFPVPARELETIGLPAYSFGGGGTGSAK